MSRYARQNALPGFGQKVQEGVTAAHVLIIGAGGLASPVLQYLVGAGVGRITLLDGDTVTLSNLHRQTLFRMCDIGAPKAVCAADHMTGLNPDCQVIPLPVPLDPANAPSLVEMADLVIDCADSFAVSYTLSDVCLAQGKPLISAAIQGTSGYCAGFCGAAPSLRAVFPDLPDRLGSCDGDGVLGPAVGIIGSLQAQMVIAVLAKLGPDPLGQLVSYDALGNRFGGFRFDGVPEPKIDFSFIAASQIREDDFVADLRAAGESGPALRRAMHLCLDQFDAPDLAPEGTRVVLACRSGLRAWQAATRLRACWPGEIALIALGDNRDTPKGD